MAKAKILLIEGSQNKDTQRDLEEQGYDVLRFEDGTRGVLAAKNGGVDLILLDVLLPDVTGNEVCRWLKMSQETKSIPVIMLTVEGSTADKVTGLQAGADDYLPKPFDGIELNARIYACLRNKVLRDELVRKNRDLEQMFRRVESMAIMDSLTEMCNRRRLEVIVDKEFSRSARYNVPLACMMIGIDFFRKINDQSGHRVGDRVLRDVGSLIKAGLREVDTAARWGGDEFVVLLPETEKQNGLEPANRILEKTAAIVFSDLPGCQVTVSIGISGLPDPAIRSGEKLIALSEFAMCEAKKKGRNRTEVA